MEQTRSSVRVGIRGGLAAGAFVAVGMVALVAVIGRSADSGSPTGQAASVAGTPVPRPVMDPAAAEPAFLASVDAWLVVLDASGRVVRVGPSREAGATLCPGARRVVIAESWRGRVEVWSTRMRRLRAQRIPLGEVHGVTCLDARGRRTAVVTGNETTATKTLRVFWAPDGRRVVLRTRGEVPRLDASGIYVSDDAGVRQRALTDGRILAGVPQPAGVYDVMPSPDGRRWLMNVMPDDTMDRVYVGDPAAGTVRMLPFVGEQALGWTGSEQFAVLGQGLARILDAGLAQRQVVTPFPAGAGLVEGDRIVAVDGQALIATSTGAHGPRVIGTVPPHTHLLAALPPAPERAIALREERECAPHAFNDGPDDMISS